MLSGSAGIAGRVAAKLGNNVPGAGLRPALPVTQHDAGNYWALKVTAETCDAALKQGLSRSEP
jgi:hypothetical protein